MSNVLKVFFQKNHKFMNLIFLIVAGCISLPMLCMEQQPKEQPEKTTPKRFTVAPAHIDRKSREHFDPKKSRIPIQDPYDTTIGAFSVTPEYYSDRTGDAELASILKALEQLEKDESRKKADQ